MAAFRYPLHLLERRSAGLSTPSLEIRGCNHLATLITPIDRIQLSNFIYLDYRVHRAIYESRDAFLI